MKWLLLDGIAETSIALPQRAEAGNIYESLPEIPGTAIRGAFASLFISNKGLAEDIEPDFIRWFENPKVRFGPLRPLPDDLPPEIQAIPFPVPRSARSCKYDTGFSKHGVKDSLAYVTIMKWKTKEENNADKNNKEDSADHKCQCCGAPMEPLDSKWMISCWNPGTNEFVAFDYDPEFRLNTHVGIGAVSEDADLSEEGRLFSIQHFPAGTRFCGWIAIDDDSIKIEEIKEEIKIEKETVLRIGRRKRSYGAMKIVGISELSETPWEKCLSLEERFSRFDKIKDKFNDSKLKIGDPNDHQFFSITCLTDLILLDNFLRPCRSITSHQIAKYLNLPENKIIALTSLTGTRLIIGWNTAHRLPKENDVAITAGSVFLFAIKKDSCPTKLIENLKSLENNGLGWRRSEGFGQVLICDPFHVEKMDKLPLEKSKESSGEQIQGFNPEVYEFLKRNSENLHKTKLSKTQINGLRERVRLYSRIQGKDGKERLKKYLEDAKARSKPDCWNKEANWHKEKESLAFALIKLFGLEDDNTDWDTVNQRVRDFAKGDLIIITSEKPLKIKIVLDRMEGSK